MFKIFSTLLDKMGNWFGIIFKIIVPTLVMYRPIKTFSFSLMVASLTFGADAFSANNLSIIVFVLLYAITVLMLFLFPKVASAMEFVLIGCYFLSLIVFKYVDYFQIRFEGIDEIVRTYSRALPLVVIFLAGKVLFFVFVKLNQDKIEAVRKAKFIKYENLR